ncbi:MAG: sugar O-acetyltransferase [Abditibacteriota bacterium]|nr:sugar O-acetyltransferase [Abditibacteriota bacterium]
MKERMLNELPYKVDDELLKELIETRKKIFAYNSMGYEDFQKRDLAIKDILGKTGEEIIVTSPFFCDYGKNIEVGENFFSSFNLTILDVAKVKIGDNCLFGPNVSIYTAGHPIHPVARNTGYEYGISVTVGNNVWLGGSVTLCPGVTIGDNTVIGAGSVVTKDIPSNVVACGNPCRVVKEITEKDKDFYYKDRKFDIDCKL